MALDLDPGLPTVLVMGGSQGAGGINDLILSTLPLLGSRTSTWQWLHLAGPGDREKVEQAYAARVFKAVVKPFLREMDLALGAATVAVSRAGASSLAEIAAVRLPSLLVPYPAAATTTSFSTRRPLPRPARRGCWSKKMPHRTRLPHGLTNWLRRGGPRKNSSRAGSVARAESGGTHCRHHAGLDRPASGRAGRLFARFLFVSGHRRQIRETIDVHRRMTLIIPTSKQPMLSGNQIASELAGLISLSTVIGRDEPLAKHTTLRVGGRADVFIEPASETDLAGVVKYCRRRHLSYFVMGRGSNLLVRDGGFRGVVVSLSQPAFRRITVTGENLHCGAGAKLKNVAVEAKRAGLSGVEFLEGIPGSVGGALA